MMDIMKMIGESIGINTLVSKAYNFFSVRSNKKLESSLKQYNDISTETFQRLFDQKVTVYQDLSAYILSYQSFKSEKPDTYYAPDGRYSAHDDRFLELSEKIRDLVFNNRLVISENLSKKYEGIYKKQAPILLSINSSSEENPQNVTGLKTQLKKETEQDILDLFNLIEKDISEIKNTLKLG